MSRRVLTTASWLLWLLPASLLPFDRTLAQDQLPQAPIEEITVEETTAQETTDEETTDEDGADPLVPYQAQVMADAEPALMEILTQTSQLILLADRPPATIQALRRRAEGDLERLQTALRSEGYYDGEVTYRIDQSVRPFTVDLDTAVGPRYTLEAFEIRYAGEKADRSDLPSDLAPLGIELGMPARAPAIVGAEKTLLRTLADSGYPLAKRRDRRVLVDHDKTSMRVELEIDEGPQAYFGAVTLAGLADVDEAYVRELIPWREGDLFDRRQVDKLRISLSETNLFSSITIKEGDSVDPEGKLPVTLTLIERPHRSVGATLTLSTNEGPGGEVFWEHRNLFSGNESLRTAASASLIEQELSAAFRKPNFWQIDQALLARAALTARDNEAFESISASLFAGLERVFSDVWSGSAGLTLEYEVVEDDEEGERKFFLVGAPVTAIRDTTDNLLNPTEGTRLSLGVTPYTGVGSDNQGFVTNEATGSAYYALDQSRDFILAGRIRLGSIIGSETSLLPATKRFYSGGAGSVRAFGFQRLGPLDDDDDPLGGRSVFEVGAEVRIRILEDFGVVPFVEGGTVGDDPVVVFDEDFLWGVGLGLRYFTAVGPLRLDLAFPLNPRDDDDFFQFYVSLGQAF